MSRVAKNPIKIVDGVNVTVEGNLVTVKGSKGELEFEMTESISLNIAEDSITCLLYTSPSPRDVEESRMPSSA